MYLNGKRLVLVGVNRHEWNPKTGRCIGMEEMDVEQAYNGNWYVEGYAPEKPAPTWEEIDKAREQYREEHIDTRTKARVRKQANGTWTDEDEQAYLALDAEVTAYIEKHFPYPVE